MEELRLVAEEVAVPHRWEEAEGLPKASTRRQERRARQGHLPLHLAVLLERNTADTFAHTYRSHRR